MPTEKKIEKKLTHKDYNLLEQSHNCKQYTFTKFNIWSPDYLISISSVIVSHELTKIILKLFIRSLC
jgi:hypothetical protein